MAERKEFESTNFTDEELVTASTETIGAHPSQESLWAQAELNRRLMKSIRDLSKSSDTYSRRLLVLTFILALIALEQLAVTIFPIPNSFWQRVTLGLLALGSVVYVLWNLTREE